jgi:hypothetical protein
VQEDKLKRCKLEVRIKVNNDRFWRKYGIQVSKFFSGKPNVVALWRGFSQKRKKSRCQEQVFSATRVQPEKKKKRRHC